MKFRTVLTIMSISALAGCAYLPLRPGRATMNTGRLHTEVRQSQNPQSSTTQKYERTTEAGGTKTTERNEVVIGAAQKDTAREMAAKLGSLKGVVWVGVLIFLFGAASLFYPPLKLIVGSVTTSAAACAAGLALIVLPSFIVGHELLLLFVAVGAVGIWWLAHHHSAVSTELKVLKSKLTL